MQGREIRRLYTEFFREKGHEIVPSASLVPHDDPTLLWINSGMAPLKKYFDGRVVPTNPRLTNSQKCIRTNDIENVGKTARHHTFFEMLGNFSIGDYFKREAIHYAYEFLTDRLKLDVSRLSITIHPEDDEAFLIWHREIGFPEEKILRLEENFWDIGEGPCGPNSEIFYDRGENVGCGRETCDASCDCDRHLEIWNLVFSQYNHNADGSYTPLPKKNIDTGMGLERTASVLQDKPSNYETDLFMPIIEAAAQRLNVRYGENEAVDVALKVIADHARAVVFSITDGVAPSNEGRGYVIRRLLRRAVRYGKQLGFGEPFLHSLVPVVAGMMDDAYPEIAARAEHTMTLMRLEEERFHETLADGEALLAKSIARLREMGSTVLSGAEAFRLYDTFGFPIDLTEEIAKESGVEIDRNGFAEALEAQRQRARSARQQVDSMQVQSGELADLLVPSVFVGYDTLKTDAHVVALYLNGKAVEQAGALERVLVVLDQTPFYAESGGQVADRGIIRGHDFELRVEDVKKAPNGQHIHICEVALGSVRTVARVVAEVDSLRRAAITKNHTATHLLHYALRTVLGEHVAQAGSLVLPDRLRFDFSHTGAISREDLERVELLVNQAIWDDEPVTVEEMAQSDAKALGAMALFGEKYGERVRVVRAGSQSIELCGGCHVSHNGQINLFRLVSESGIGSGVRRVEAVTGAYAYEFVKAEERLLLHVSEQLKSPPALLQKRVESMNDHVRLLEKEVEALTAQLNRAEAAQLDERITQHANGRALVAAVREQDVEGLRAMADYLRQKHADLLIVLGSSKAEKAAFVVSVPPLLQARGAHAGKLVKEIASLAGGAGGGKADLAQAGGRNPEKLPKALEHAEALLAKLLSDTM
ncbi:alanine--tRNA ligase [Ferroacidibacillus organovorans]|uniref:Alanine--tRNA ligase n=1 Tax=Ferroacidibacillus organovorans TaxID=1765683 RepID=A0A101XTV8_9BACL|nr:alanine--tRNA ligase [Ferroacidibacillus organovorans]KUO97360.1 alanine--tRNA ligase [Ferroacidibacillus organovorans]